MNKGKKSLLFAACSLALVLLLHPSDSHADPGSQYCITPAFVAGNIPPNLLLIIDNSASMYDLVHVDKGKKHCSVSSAPCFEDADCGAAGGTCSVFDRRPFYCYDESYSNEDEYFGYFETKDADGNDIFYEYRPGTDDFVKVTSGSFPFNCGSVAANTKTFPGTMCVEFTRPNTLTAFVAKGNYLNWLTASKLDVEKKILTGGKYNGSALLPESRGCVGQGYVKDANAGNFTNYADANGDGAENLNHPLGVTFTVTGPPNPFNKAAPSTGGQTYINLYSGNDPYDAALCQAAVNKIEDPSGGAGQVTAAVEACLTSTTPVIGTCTEKDVDTLTGLRTVTRACEDTADCNLPFAAAHCSKDSNLSCTIATQATDCFVENKSVCTAGKLNLTCAQNSDCDVKTCTGTGAACSVASDCLKATVPGVCSKGTTPAGGCTTNDDCRTKNAVCEGYAPGYNYGTCGVSTAGTCTTVLSAYQGPCIPATGGNLGACQFSPHETLVKTSILFASSMQTCWAYRKNLTTPGVDEYNSIVHNCPTVYAGYKSCSNNAMLTCNADADCGAGNTCLSGPAAIGPGNSALLCSTNYEGQFFEHAGGTTWRVKSALPSPPPTGCLATDTVQSCMLKINLRFCGDMAAPAVTDPSDGPSDTSKTDNLPAILSGIGVDAQLGGVIASMRAKITTPTTPTGLIQQFGDKMRIGTMSFNPYGSASETGIVGVGTQKTCSNDPERVCWQNIDCGTGNTCSADNTVNYDGASINYPIGLGKCATMTTTPCTTDAQCSGGNTCLNKYCGTLSSTVCTTKLTCSGASQACIRNEAGSHTDAASLVGSIDAVKAKAWTPLSEAFYNALGYFAAIPQAGGSFKSRVTGAAVDLTPVRLNSLRTDSTDFTPFADQPVDFNEVLHPSEYRCQQNYVLLITDGSSTADRNTSVTTLAGKYAAQAGVAGGNCSVPVGKVDYGGTANLPILSFIGKRQNLASFSTAEATPLHCSSSTATVCEEDADCPSGETCTNARYPRDSFTTYVVFNGDDTGTNDACSAATLLGETASKGGTTLYSASDPDEFRDALSDIFQNIAAKAASGTAASILSNSEGSGANILQAVFFPKKVFENQTSANWIGEMQNLWYFVDPLINRSTIREDTNGDKEMHLLTDKVVSFRFDSTDNTTYAYLSSDLNGDGLGDTVEVKKDSDRVRSVWRAGKQLWARDLSVAANHRNLKTTINGTSLIDFSSATFDGEGDVDNAATLAPYLNVAAAEAPKLINYVHGVDQAGYRSRTVSMKVPGTDDNPADDSIVSGVWRLGDIISSTPRIQSTTKLNGYSLAPPSGYSDSSYASFIGSNQYKSRGMVYVGANDGMLHAFKLGLLDVTASGSKKAALSGTGLGEEQWAYIPKQALPYLKYYTDPDYNHLYYVDGTTLLFDASIGDRAGDGGCTPATYSECVKQPSVVTSANNVDAAKNTWKSILIGGMGLGGASTTSCAAGANCVQTPLADPADATKGLGFSSYFALDVTNPTTPQLLWEFNNNQAAGLGFATTGPAVVRVGDQAKNGKWFAVFGSGPTGSIDTASNQFMGRSNQNLKFFVVDLRSGTLVRTIDTGITEAFAGSLVGSAIDADRWNPYTTGHYQDDAILVGYTKKSSGGTWTDGGVIRIVTKESSDVATWTWSHVVQDTGPVTTAISRLQDRKNKNLWLYFGTGRYFNRSGSDVDDKDSLRAIYGIKDPCYDTDANPGNRYDKTCSATVTTGITNQSNSITAVGSGGWKIDLDAASGGYGAERVVTDAVALTNGTIFLTSFMPTADPCGFGGNSFLWALGYDTGGRPSDAALAGKALIQLSTGEFKEVNLSEAFGSGAARLLRRSAVPMTGKPPADAFPIVSKSGNKPVKKIMHIQER